MATFTNFFGAFDQSDSKTETNSPVQSDVITASDVSSGNSPVTSPVSKTDSKTESKASFVADVTVQEEKSDDTKGDENVILLNDGSHLGANNKNVIEIFKEKTNIELIKSLKSKTISELSHNATLKCLTGRWASLKKEEIEEMNFDTIKAFLSTTDYNHSVSKNKNALEYTLYLMVCRYVEKNKTTTPEQFEELFDLLRHQLLTPTSIGHLADLDQCKALLESSHAFCKKLIGVYNFLANGKSVITQSNRFPKVTAQQIEQKLTPVAFSELKVGDSIDAQDSNGSWYTARVLKKESDFVSKNGEANVTVSFDGFSALCDEVFTEESLGETVRVSKFGTMTGGVAHQNNANCKCVSCLKSKSGNDSPSLESLENIGALGQLLLASVFGGSSMRLF